MGTTQDQTFFKWLAEHDPDIETVFDVGAHVGAWSRQFADFFPDANFHLFEPRLKFDDETKQAFLKNASGFQHQTIEAAVSDTKGVAQFSVQGNMGNASSLLLPQESRREKIVDVDVITIDDYVAENEIEKIDFLKMDIQGGELAALRGAGSALKKTKYLFLETWLVSSYNQQTPHMFEIFDHLRKYGIFPIDFFGGHRNQSGLLAHIDVVYINSNLSVFPKYFHKALVERLAV
ncbi:MAG: FkbM family methyltransferase [Oceanicaulis sp.]